MGLSTLLPREVLNYFCITLLVLLNVLGAMGSTLSHDHLEDSRVMREVAQSLLPAFGINGVDPAKHHKKSVPNRFMTELYSMIADPTTGLTSRTNIYGSDTVTSLPLVNITGNSSIHHIIFDLNDIKIEGELKVVEIRIYKSKFRLPKQKLRKPKSHLFEICVYQAKKPIDKNGVYTMGKLLGAKRVSLHSKGWEAFQIKPTILEWMRNKGENFGFLIVLKDIYGRIIKSRGALRLGGRHAHRYQPILVFYYKATQNNNYKAESVFHQNKWLKSQQMNHVSEKVKRMSSMDDKTRRKRSTNEAICQRHNLTVDFHSLKWDSWVIAPKSYNAYYCKGSCPYPLGQHLNPTNHAIVQAIIYQVGSVKGVTPACCVPNDLSGVSLLYYDDRNHLVLKLHKNMVAKSCGCH